MNSNYKWHELIWVNLTATVGQREEKKWKEKRIENWVSPGVTPELRQGTVNTVWSEQPVRQEENKRVWYLESPKNNMYKGERMVTVLDTAYYSSKVTENWTLDSATHRSLWSEVCSVVFDCLWPHGICSPWDSPCRNTGVGSLSLLQRIFPTQGSNTGAPYCRRILYQLNHKGSTRILGWIAYPFSSRSSWPRNWTRVSCIEGGFFTNWAIMKVHQLCSHGCPKRSKQSAEFL